MCDIEFTVERGKLWMRQTRVGKRRRPGAAFRSAPAHDRRRGTIDTDEALRRRTGAPARAVMFPGSTRGPERTLVAKA
jgi:hypothetical protein